MTIYEAEHHAFQTLVDGANISWGAVDGNNISITLGGNRTLDNVVNASSGLYVLVIKQDATGSRTLSYGSEYKFPGGVAPTLTTTANAVDVLLFARCNTTGTI